MTPSKPGSPQALGDTATQVPGLRSPLTLDGHGQGKASAVAYTEHEGQSSKARWFKGTNPFHLRSVTPRGDVRAD